MQWLLNAAGQRLQRKHSIPHTTSIPSSSTNKTYRNICGYVFLLVCFVLIPVVLLHGLYSAVIFIAILFICSLVCLSKTLHKPEDPDHFSRIVFTVQPEIPTTIPDETQDMAETNELPYHSLHPIDEPPPDYSDDSNYYYISDSENGVSGDSIRNRPTDNLVTTDHVLVHQGESEDPPPSYKELFPDQISLNFERDNE